MRVLNISRNDYANMSHENANALRSIGVECDDYCTNKHPFGYANESTLITLEGIKQIYNNYDVIQIFHTDTALLNIVQDHPNKVVYHSGTRYRQHPQYFDEVFKMCTVITDQCEFVNGLNMDYLAPHTTLRPVRKKETGKLIIGHYPSNPDVKGTEAIKRLLEPFQSDYDIRIDSTKLTHARNLKRVSECHIYVELFAPTQQGNPYGCFGVSAFEATAMGGLVVTNNINRQAYEGVYGGQCFLTPNTEEHFTNTIASLKSREYYENVKEWMHDEFHKRHSITATGTRILKLIS